MCVIAFDPEVPSWASLNQDEAELIKELKYLGHDYERYSFTSYRAIPNRSEESP